MTTPTLQSQAFTSSGTFNVPSGVTSVFVTMIGGGAGGGDQINGVNTGSAGGGAGEFAMDVALKVTSGGTVSVTIGAKGASLTDGGTTIVGPLQVVGGHHGLRASANTPPAGMGGGIGGGAFTTAAIGAAGSLESVGFFGGSSGGSGGTAGAVGFTGGGSPGHTLGAAGGTVASGWSGGGGGGSSPWGLGGAGGAGLANGVNASATSYGAGGGGSGAGSTVAGGAGCDGYVLIQWSA